MIYALTILCAQSCLAVTHEGAPFHTDAACRAAHQARRATITGIEPELRRLLGGPVTARELCGALREIRRIAPGAYPDHADEVQA